MITIDDFKYTPEDFYTTAPYEVVLAIDDPFQQRRAIMQLNDYAKSLKFTGFQKMLAEYRKSLKSTSSPSYYIDNITTFSGQPIELNAGDWEADEGGISRHTGMFEEIACVHPIMPIERLVNIDTGTEKLKIAYRKGKGWRTQIVDKRTLATASSITSLADCGVAVNSESAKILVRYLHDMENLNYDLIPESLSVSRLGWIEDEGFSPYCGSLIFDGDANFKSFFESVTTHGTFKNWLDMCSFVRNGTVTSRIVLAASFASVLVKPLGGLPFFVHLWGGTETGKTVALMLAASVWANPELGKFIHTFNSTSVGKEMSAAFVNSLPLILDELQIVKTKGGQQDEDIYKLAEGVGKMRSNKGLGINKTATWANCILTSGEMPITNSRSGGGAVNRILEIECKDKLFYDDARLIVDFAKKNYGHAGKAFVEKLQYEDGAFDKADALFQEFYDKLSKSDTTEKQAMAAAIVLVGDALATEWIFKDSKALTVGELKEFLQSKAAVSANDRGYRYMCEWVSQNANKLTGSSEHEEVWGIFEQGMTGKPDIVYIVSSRFHQVAEDAGYNASALLSYMKQQELIQTKGKGKGNTVGKRINKILTECVAMRLPEGFEDLPDDEQIPFPS